MSDYDFMVSICKAVLTPPKSELINPMTGLPPTTEEEKLEVLQHEYEMEQMNQEEEWPPCDFALDR